MQAKLIIIERVTDTLRKELNDQVLTPLKKDYLVEKIDLLEAFLRKHKLN